MGNVLLNKMLASLRPALRALWYDEPNAAGHAINYAKFCSRSHNAVIRVYDAAGNVIETHEHAGEFKENEMDPDKCWWHAS